MPCVTQNPRQTRAGRGEHSPLGLFLTELRRARLLFFRLKAFKTGALCSEQFGSNMRAGVCSLLTHLSESRLISWVCLRSLCRLVTPVNLHDASVGSTAADWAVASVSGPPAPPRRLSTRAHTRASAPQRPQRSPLKCFFVSIGRGLKEFFKNSPLSEIESPQDYFSQ